jgi:hypothetical protein
MLPNSAHARNTSDAENRLRRWRGISNKLLGAGKYFSDVKYVNYLGENIRAWNNRDGNHDEPTESKKLRAEDYSNKLPGQRKSLLGRKWD